MTARLRNAALPLKPLLSLLRSYMIAPLAADLATLSVRMDELAAVRAAGAAAPSVVVPAEIARAVAPDADDRAPQFVTVSLPSGKTYSLSVAAHDRDAYHAAVVSEAAYDATWHFLAAWIRSRDVFYDLGANIGTISIPAAVNGATVHSFELLSSNVAHIVESITKNAITSISVVLGAVSDRCDYLGFSGISAWGTVKADTSVLIPTIVIDLYTKIKQIDKVDVMKIDIEGSENLALVGARATIERDHPDIIIECNAVTCGNHHYSYKEILKFLSDRGYTIYRIFNRKLFPWPQELTQEVVFADYLATTKSPDAIQARSGWSITAHTSEEIVDSLIQQDQHGPLHGMFVLAVAEKLPAAVVSDVRVVELLAKWQLLQDDAAMSVLRAGSAALA